MASKGNWTCKTEVLRWLINAEAGTVILPEQKHLELLQLLATLSTQTPDGPEGTGALGGENLLHATRGAQSGSTPLPNPACPTHLAEIVCPEPSYLGFYYASGIGAREVLLNLSGLGTSLVWRHPWPTHIIAALISDKNPKGTLTNSDLDLVALVLHKATLLETYPEATMAALLMGSDNTRTVSWSTREASTIKPVVSDLL